MFLYPAHTGFNKFIGTYKMFSHRFLLGHKIFQFQQNLFQQNTMWVSFSIVRAARMLIKFHRLWFSKISYFGDKTYPSNDFFSIWKWSIWKKNCNKISFPIKIFPVPLSGVFHLDWHPQYGGGNWGCFQPKYCIPNFKNKVLKWPTISDYFSANTFVHKIRQLIFREILL